MENSIPDQITNFLTHQPNEPSGNMALHSSGNANKAIPLLINYYHETHRISEGFWARGPFSPGIYLLPMAGKDE